MVGRGPVFLSENLPKSSCSRPARERFFPDERETPNAGHISTKKVGGKSCWLSAGRPLKGCLPWAGEKRSSRRMVWM